MVYVLESLARESRLSRQASAPSARSSSRSTARSIDSTLSCCRLSGARAREAKEARASGGSSSSHCSRGSSSNAAAAAAVVTAAAVAAAAAGSSVRLAGNSASTAEAGSSCRPVLGQWEEAARLLGLRWTTLERNCPNKGTVDATRADTRHGANVCSLCLSGDDSGEATLEEVEEKFGGLEEVRGFVNAVRAQSEAIMTAAVQQGTHTAHPLHTLWSRISDSLTHPPIQTAPVLPEWNRLYVANSLHLRPCHLLYEQHGTARLMFACDYRDSNSLGQLKDSNRLRAYVPALSHCVVTDLTDAQQLQLQLDSTGQTEPTAPTAQHTEQRHLYEPLMGAPSECQVVLERLQQHCWRGWDY